MCPFKQINPFKRLADIYTYQIKIRSVYGDKLSGPKFKTSEMLLSTKQQI